MPVLVTKAKVIENSAVILTAKVKDPVTGTMLIPADVTSMLLRVYEVPTSGTPTLIVPAGESEPYTGTALTVADVVLDPPDTGPLANGDAEGINVRLALDGSHLPDGDKTYRAEVKVTPAAGDAFYLLWELKTLAVHSE